MNAKLWRFEALDTLFFRDGKPFNAGESVWIDSQFPPTGRTIQGAIRTAILKHVDADFEAFGAGHSSPHIQDGRSLTEDIGSATGLGRLRLTGPFLTKDNALLFPAPLDLVRAREEFVLLAPGPAAQSDLGMIRWPSLTDTGTDTVTAKTLEERYVTAGAMEGLLAGNAQRVLSAEDSASSCAGNLWPLYGAEPSSPGLVDREPRVGIGRDNIRRKYKEGMLYSIAPVRPRDGVALAMMVDGLDPSYWPPTPFGQRLGGEGKFARVSIDPPPIWPSMPLLVRKQGRICFKLVLTTPAHFTTRWLPPGFEKQEHNGLTVWRGALKDVRCDIVSACIAKPVRIGGWDMVRNGPRPDEACVPAGSVYFCEADASHEETLYALHGKQIGEHTEYGFGHVLVGTWATLT